MAPYQLQIEPRQQIVGAVSAARAHDGTHVGAREHGVEFLEPALFAASEVQLTLPDGFEIGRDVAQPAQGFASRFQRSSLDVAGGRHNADHVARTQRWRLERRWTRGARHGLYLNPSLCRYTDRMKDDAMNAVRAFTDHTAAPKNCHPERSEGSRFSLLSLLLFSLVLSLASLAQTTSPAPVQPADDDKPRIS